MHIRGHSWRKRAGLLALGATLALGGTALARKPHELGLSRNVEVRGRRLVLNGAAVQRKMFWDIYAVALYLETPSRDAETVLRSDTTRRIQLRLLRDASAHQLRGALRDGLKRSVPDMAPVQERMDTLLAAIPDLRHGDELFITYVPGEGTLLEGRGCEPVRLPGKDFADALFSLWLGADPNMTRIRRELLLGPPKS